MPRKKWEPPELDKFFFFSCSIYLFKIKSQREVKVKKRRKWGGEKQLH